MYLHLLGPRKRGVIFSVCLTIFIRISTNYTHIVLKQWVELVLNSTSVRASLTSTATCAYSVSCYSFRNGSYTHTQLAEHGRFREVSNTPFVSWQGHLNQHLWLQRLSCKHIAGTIHSAISTSKRQAGIRRLYLKACTSGPSPESRGGMQGCWCALEVAWSIRQRAVKHIRSVQRCCELVFCFKERAWRNAVEVHWPERWWQRWGHVWTWMQQWEIWWTWLLVVKLSSSLHKQR